MVPGKNRFGDAGNSVRIHSGQKYTGFYLSRSNWGIIVNGLQRMTCDPKGNTVISLYVCNISAHGKERRHDPFHGTALDRVIAGKLRYKILSCKNTGNQAGSCATVSNIQNINRGR